MIQIRSIDGVRKLDGEFLEFLDVDGAIKKVVVPAGKNKIHTFNFPDDAEQAEQYRLLWGLSKSDISTELGKLNL